MLEKDSIESIKYQIYMVLQISATAFTSDCATVHRPLATLFHFSSFLSLVRRNPPAPSVSKIHVYIDKSDVWKNAKVREAYVCSQEQLSSSSVTNVIWPLTPEYTISLLRACITCSRGYGNMPGRVLGKFFIIPTRYSWENILISQQKQFIKVVWAKPSTVPLDCRILMFVLGKFVLLSGLRFDK